MEEKQNLLQRKLDEKAFENARKAIQGGKESNSLTNPVLVEELVENYKDKTVQAPIEVIITSSMFLNSRELLGVIEAIKHTIRIKVAEELSDKVSSLLEILEEKNQSNKD